MKVGIDISQIVYRGSGVATYTENLVKNLLEIDKNNEYVLFFSSLRRNLKISVFAQAMADKQNFNAKVKSFKFPPLMLEFLWNNLHVIPIETFTGKIDVFHTSDWLEPPAGCPKITTIHDLAIFKYPGAFAPQGGHNIVENMKRKLELVKKDEDFVIAVSQSTKKDIIEILGIAEEKITVIYEAADERFSSKIKEQTSKIEETKKKHSIKGDYILSVGTMEPRKNLVRLIEAFSSIIKESPDINLVIAGNVGWGEELQPVENIVLTGFVPQEDLPYLYAGAKFFVYPSLYEGFGLPVLEAMACGVPVVCSNVSSLPEVGGDAAIYVDPEKVESIADGISKVLNFNETERQKVIEMGFCEAQKFSWQKTARETLDVYQKIFTRS